MEKKFMRSLVSSLMLVCLLCSCSQDTQSNSVNDFAKIPSTALSLKWERVGGDPFHLLESSWALFCDGYTVGKIEWEHHNWGLYVGIAYRPEPTEKEFSSYFGAVKWVESQVNCVDKRLEVHKWKGTN